MNQDITIGVSLKDGISEVMGKIGKAVSNVTEKFGILGSLYFGGVTLGLGAVIDKASDLQEATSKFGVVYKDIIGIANEVSSSLISSYGLTKKESKQFFADLGDMVSGFGMSQQEALKFSEEVIKLGTDLASFTNLAGGTTEAVDRLSKGFLGEHENLKALGIIINEEILKQQLLKNNTAQLTGLELEKAKITARLQIATRQSANAIGDYARNNQSYAIMMKGFMGTVEDISNTFGMIFIPVMEDVLKTVTPLLASTGNFIEKNKELVKIVTLTIVGILGLGTAFFIGSKIIAIGTSIVVGFTKAIAITKTALIGLNAIIAANPIVAIISLGLFLLYLFKDELWGVFKAVGKIIGEFSFLTDIIGFITNMVKDFLGIIKASFSWVGKIIGFFKGNNKEIKVKTENKNINEDITSLNSIGYGNAPNLLHTMSMKDINLAGKSQTNNYTVNIENPVVKNDTDIDLLKKQIEESMKKDMRVNKDFNNIGITA